MTLLNTLLFHFHGGMWTRALRFQLDGLHNDAAEAMVAALNIVSSVHSSSLDKLLQRELNYQVGLD